MLFMISKEIFELYPCMEVYWWVKDVNIILQKSMQRLEIWCVGSLVDTIYDSKINFGILTKPNAIICHVVNIILS